ncbi:hypothetical protein ABVT39_026743 [Epinephelus coioides]
MSSVDYLREFVNIRLTAAAEEIFGVFKRTIVEYEEELDRQRKLLDVVLKPEIKLHRIELPQQYVCKEEEEDDDEEEELPQQYVCKEEEEVLSDQQQLHRTVRSPVDIQPCRSAVVPVKPQNYQVSAQLLRSPGSLVHRTPASLSRH